jgi:hypothetical protein
LAHEFSAPRPGQHGLLADKSSPSVAHDVVVLQSAGQLQTFSHDLHMPSPQFKHVPLLVRPVNVVQIPFTGRDVPE